MQYSDIEKDFEKDFCIIENVISNKFEKELINILDSLDWEKNASYHAQYYGYKNSVREKTIKVVSDIPFFLDELINATKSNIPNFTPNQCVVRKLHKKGGFVSSLDPSSFGEIILFFALNEDIAIVFENQENRKTIILPSCSMAILQGKSRNCYKYKVEKNICYRLGKIKIRKEEDYKGYLITFCRVN